jgi:hypothetical protein
MTATADLPASVTLTVYLRPGLAEVSRVLQSLVLQPITVDRFDAGLRSVDTGKVNGLDALAVPVMRLLVTGSVASSGDLERVTKRLNRLVDVYKVVAA